MIFITSFTFSINFITLYSEFALTRVMENSTNESKLLQLAGKVLNVSDFSILSDSFKDISNEIVGEIHSTLCGWPSHCTGYGLTIVKMNGQVCCYFSHFVIIGADGFRAVPLFPLMSRRCRPKQSRRSL